MEKALECGVRLTTKSLELSEDDFKKQISFLIPELRKSILSQRNVYLATAALAQSKSIDVSLPYKTVEFYCSSKDGAEIISEHEKGIECGIRIKEFALDMDDKTFEKYVDGCFESFQLGLMEQRRAFLADLQSKNAELDGVLKGVELYCRVKNMCA